MRAPSLFRPKQAIDQSVLEENRKLVAQIDRRRILRGTVSLGALTMLTGCNVTDRPAVQRMLQLVSEWNDGVQGLLFDPDRLAPTYSEAEVVKPPRFNAYYEIEEVKPVDAAGWRLELSRPHRRQAPVDAATDLRSAGAGNHHPAHLRRGLGLYRPVVGTRA